MQEDFLSWEELVNAYIGIIESDIKSLKCNVNASDRMVEQFQDWYSNCISSLKTFSDSLKELYDDGICPQIIQEAFSKMDWQILYKVKVSSSKDMGLLRETIKNFKAIVPANECKPTEVAPSEPESPEELLSLEELLSFVPAEHLEAAKHAFERLLQDGTIKRAGNRFEWLKEPKNGLIWYFAANANVEWSLIPSNGNFRWKPFAELFGVDSARFIEWQNKTQWSKSAKGIRNLPKGFEYIEELF